MLNRLRNAFGYDLAIDLGTSNTLLGVPGEGVVLCEPSVVAVHHKTRRILSGGQAVGHLAKQLSGRTPDSIDVVRPLQSGVITDFVLCEAMLRYFLRKVRRPRWWRRPRVVIAVPGCITPVEKRALYNSALRAGARQVFVLPEAKAAAIGMGLPIAEPVANMVCDIGGGTTEVAVLSLGEIVSQDSIRVGGDSMDQSVVDFLRRAYSLKISLPAAERLRIEIGSAAELPAEQSCEVSGVDTISRLPRRAVVTSEEIRHALAEPLEKIIDAIKLAIDQCGEELAADLIDHGIVLAGGGSLLQGMDRFVEQQTGLPTRLCPDPLSAVAKGTLICTQHISQWRMSMQNSDEGV